MRIAYATIARLPTEKANGYQIAKMCEALATLGHDVELIIPPIGLVGSPPGIQDLVASYRIRPVFKFSVLGRMDWVSRIDGLPGLIEKILYTLWVHVWAGQLIRALRGKSIDLVYTRDPFVAKVLARAGLPYVVEMHRIQRSFIGRRAVFRALHAATLRVAVTMTGAMRRCLIDEGLATADQVLVAHDAVDIAAFPCTGCVPANRPAFGLPSAGRVIGYIGRFSTMGMEKGIPHLIRSYAEFRKRSGSEPCCLFCLGGPLDQTDSYRKLARSCGVPDEELVIRDRVPNHLVPAAIACCDVVTIPWEDNEFSAICTSPMKLFEYMAVGVPIVASDLPSMREILRDGENGVLCPPGDPVRWGAAFARLLTEREHAAILASQARTDVEHMTWLARAEGIMKRVQEAAPC